MILDAIVWIAFAAFVLLGAIVYLIEKAWRTARRIEERWAPWGLQNYNNPRNHETT